MAAFSILRCGTSVAEIRLEVAMRMVLALLALMTASYFERASAADLAPTAPYARGDSGRGSYGELWGEREVLAGPFRPARRVMGGPDYVGSPYGLGKPPVSGIGPRPDWGRSSYD